MFSSLKLIHHFERLLTRKVHRLPTSFHKRALWDFLTNFGFLREHFDKILEEIKNLKLFRIFCNVREIIHEMKLITVVMTYYNPH